MSKSGAAAAAVRAAHRHMQSSCDHGRGAEWRHESQTSLEPTANGGQLQMLMTAMIGHLRLTSHIQPGCRLVEQAGHSSSPANHRAACRIHHRSDETMFSELEGVRSRLAPLRCLARSLSNRPWAGLVMTVSSGGSGGAGLSFRPEAGGGTRD
ncbi:hypothetical protein INR49_000330 [Caranx melampygus]|nr:hypothetical protein INR49_000330 [Caranx melampygus]